MLVKFFIVIFVRVRRPLPYSLFSNTSPNVNELSYWRLWLRPFYDFSANEKKKKNGG